MLRTLHAAILVLIPASALAHEGPFVASSEPALSAPVVTGHIILTCPAPDEDAVARVTQAPRAGA